MVNRFCKFAMFMLCVNSMCGCSGRIVSSKLNLIPESDDTTNIQEYVLPIDYDFDEAIDDGYVLYNNNDVVDNEEKIDEFYNKSRNNEECKIYIVHFTTEGDPIISTYVYKDGMYMVYIDSRRDEYGIQGIDKKVIKRIEISEDNLGRKIIIEKY